MLELHGQCLLALTGEGSLPTAAFRGRGHETFGASFDGTKYLQNPAGIKYVITHAAEPRRGCFDRAMRCFRPLSLGVSISFTSPVFRRSAQLNSVTEPPESPDVRINPGSKSNKLVRSRRPLCRRLCAKHFGRPMTFCWC